MIEKKHIEELNRIILSIKAGNDETVAFSSYLKELCSVEDQSYTPSGWTQQWRKLVYEFGGIFSKQDAGPYLKITSQFLGEDNMCEVAAFFSSEIIWNYYEEASEYNKIAVKSYISSFPHNPEFHNNYALFLVANRSFEKALDEHKVAIRLDDENGSLVNNYTYAVKQYFEYLLRKNKSDKAEALIKDALKFVEGTRFKGIGKWEQIARLTSLRDRLNDFQMVLESVSEFKGEIEAKIRGEQKRLIEVLGIFSAVMAFILTNIAIGLANLNTVQVLSLMFGMALTLMMFASSISILFSSRRRKGNEWCPFLRDTRFWAIVVLLIMLLSWIFFNHRFINQDNKEVSDESHAPVTVSPEISDMNIGTSTSE